MLSDGRIAQKFQLIFMTDCFDAKSNDRVPFVWLGDGLAGIPIGSDLSRWLGRDVLAEPCRHAEAEYGTELMSPWNGICTGFGAFSSECNRCIMQG